LILGSLAVAGIGLVAIAAPNTLQLLKKFDPDWLAKRSPKQRLQEVASKMKRKGLVEFVEEHGRKKLRITESGRRKLDSATLSSTPPPRPKKWDGKWRIVIFDIPETKHSLRTKIRAHVRAFGFKKLQGSVWVYPYDCEDLILLLKAELKIGVNLLYIIADAIEYDLPLRKEFGLK
jgi:DNA-binding transcriptional regulator PaaX